MTDATEAQAAGHPHDASPDNPLDRATFAAIKLKAMLENTYGGSGEAFREMNVKLQDAYMWACADLATELMDSIDQIRPAPRTMSAG